MSMTARLTEEHAQAVLNCLSSFRGRNVVPLKQFQRLLGHMASAAAVTPLGLLHMRPLQHWLHSRVPQVGMAPRYTASGYHPAVSPLPQPLDRPCLSTGRGAPRTSVPAYCCRNRCLQHGVGRYMQRAGSLGALDRAPTALAHQLPRAVGSAFSLMAVPATAVGQARASPHGQHCGGLVHQPAGRYTITPGVLPPPMRWRMAPLWQTSAELRAGQHRTPSQDSTISALSQFLPVCWVSNGREELAGVTLAAPFPLTRGYERLFSPPVQFPGR